MFNKKGVRSLLCVLGFLLVCCLGRSQTTAMLMPVPRQPFVDSSGNPLSGGKVYTCTAGLACPGNPLATYTDSTGATPNANPVILDAAGLPTASGTAVGIWLGPAAYKIVVQNSGGVTQWTIDNVSTANLKSVNSITSATCTSPGPAATGFIKMCNGDAVNWQNQANTAAIGLAQAGAAATGTGNVADVLRYGDSTHGGLQAQRFIDFSAAPAQSGVVATGNNVVAVAARNAAGSADIAALTVNASNNVLVGKVTVTQPAAGSTITIADGKTLTANNSITMTGPDGVTQNFPASVPTGGALCYGQMKVQAFTASGTFTIPAGVTSAKASVTGGGGAGGGSTATFNGGGGGSGSSAYRWFSGLTPGNTITVTIGPGGAGVSAAAGGPGGISSLTSGTEIITTVTTNGGLGGASTGAGSAGGGAGAAGAGGDLNLGGAGGNSGIPGTNVGGNGGNSIYGGGGQDAAGAVGNPATAFGAGGGGAGNGANRAGGDGAAGLVIFEYCQ